MNFEFSEEQNMLREQAQGFLASNCSMAVVRRVLDGDEQYAADLWQKVAEMGWTATVIPEEYEGLGLSYLELSVVAEELGRALAPIPFSSSVFFPFSAFFTLAGPARGTALLGRPGGLWAGLLGALWATSLAPAFFSRFQHVFYTFFTIVVTLRLFSGNTALAALSPGLSGSCPFLVRFLHVFFFRFLHVSWTFFFRFLLWAGRRL